MKPLVKPAKLLPGDTVATVSLSWGGAGDPGLLWRYRLGRQRLRQQFGLEVVEMPGTLKGSDYLYRHPEERAADLMEAFANPNIKAIFSCIGGDDSIRLLPHIDFSVLRANPKILMGYSDTTIAHLLCFKAGLSSFYGPSVLGEFAENVEIFPYTAAAVRAALFETAPLGPVAAAPAWTGEYMDWSEQNKNRPKTLLPGTGYRILQGQRTARGRLFGGCMEVLEMAKGTGLWPAPGELEGAIWFFETSEEAPPPNFVEYWLRGYAAQGLLQGAAALLFGRPYQGRHAEAYQTAIQKVLAEAGLARLPVVYGMDFGHNQPMCVLPYGALAEVNCQAGTVAICEAGVV
ncbi:MAG: S66 peptidase family protein [Oscillospiraceae bacterium]